MRALQAVSMKKSFKKLMSSGNFRTNRLEAFSDGVFAIVITLLVLELRVPEVHGWPVSQELLGGLKNLLPKFLRFAVSFIYITIYWINHHQLFHLLQKTDRGLFWLNSFFLMCLAFIPFPTALIGSYPSETVAVVFYGVAMMVTAISFVLMKIYIFYSGELIETSPSVRPSVFYLAAGPLLYCAAVLLALVDIRLAIAIYLLIPIIYFFAGGLEEA